MTVVVVTPCARDKPSFPFRRHRVSRPFRYTFLAIPTHAFPVIPTRDTRRFRNAENKRIRARFSLLPGFPFLLPPCRALYDIIYLCVCPGDARDRRRNNNFSCAKFSPSDRWRRWRGRRQVRKANTPETSAVRRDRF